MAPQQPSQARVSYVIPAPAQIPPRLALPPLGTTKNGAIRPLLIPAPASTPTATTRSTQANSGGHQRTQLHPRHRLGISSLALDSSTQLSGKTCPEGILYTGGRDGQIIAWELGLKTKQRQHRDRYAERGPVWRKGRWEILTGWSDIDERDEEEEETIVNDGDILGDVVDSGGHKRRKSEALTEEIHHEETWEYDADSSSSPPSTFRQCLQTHTDWVNDILLCNLNQTVVSASSDGSIRAWSPHLSHTTDPVLVGMHEDYVRCLTTSPHQSWIASGSFDRTIKLWDLSRTAPPSSNHYASGASLYNPPLSTLSLSTPSQKTSVYAIATDHVGSMIGPPASGSPERVVRMWDPRSGKRTGKLVGHTDNIRAIILSADGRYILTGSADASIKLWSLASQRCLHTFAHHTDSVWALSSQHPSLEIFYSGDRSGIVSRVDMEGCNAVDEGECLVICNATRTPEADNADHHVDGRTSILGDTFRLQDGAGVNNIVTMDDRLVWTATGSSSIKRWRAPPRRSVRMGLLTAHGSPYTSQSRRTSGSSDVQSPRRGYSLGFDKSRRFSGEVSPPVASPTSARFGKTSASTSFSFSNDPLAQDDATRFDIPYQSLVRLVSPNDPYGVGAPLSVGGYGGTSRGRADADVATLYSAASVRSISLPVSRQSQPPFVTPEAVLRTPFRQSTGSTLSPRFAAVPPDLDANWTASPRAEYEGRELAAAATPLELYPDDIIQGEHGLVRSMMLNDRMHALTINTAGCVAVWDVVRCRCVGWYDRRDILTEMGSTNGTEGSLESDIDSRSPRELLETVRARIEGESVISPWSTVDTRIGNLTVHLSERCFETEIYADEAGYGSERYYDIEQRLNVGKWVLSNLFDNFVREQLKTFRRLIPNSNTSLPPSSSTHRSESTAHRALDPRLPAHSSDTETRSRSLSALSISSGGSNTSRTAVSTVITAHSLTPAILPDMSLIASRPSSFPLAAPLIPIVAVKDAHLSPTPQSHATHTPRPRPTIETTSPAKSAPGGEADYFASRATRLSASGTVLDEFSGWGGPGSKEQDKDASVFPTPSTPSGGGFMGRLRHFGRSSKRPSSADIATTPGGSAVPQTRGSHDGSQKDEPDGSLPETDQSRFLDGLATQPFHPPTAADAPPLNLPQDTEVVLAEKTQSDWSNIYRGTVATTGQDTSLLDKVMPMWLMQYLLTNKVPIVPNIKLSFGVVAWPGKAASGDLSTDTPTALTANRYLRARKILTYVQEKIDKTPSRAASRSGSISGTPRSSVDGPRAARSGSSLSQSMVDTDTSKRPKPEDVYELLCNDVVLPLNMTLATIRHYVWRSSAELLLHYRRKV
ncbi:hypothetical protein JB92DRAFT_2251756 [Gautieria morchelliformis]|nr:hypothetical protein JB92DRAFT_2251756 [Gautieria morchelliformis]